MLYNKGLDTGGNMKAKNDFSTIELPIARPRGRPPTTAQTPEALRKAAALRQAKRRIKLKENGLVPLTVSIPADLHLQLTKFLQFKDTTKDAVVERFLRHALRKR